MLLISEEKNIGKRNPLPWEKIRVQEFDFRWLKFPGKKVQKSGHDTAWIKKIIHNWYKSYNYSSNINIQYSLKKLLTAFLAVSSRHRHRAASGPTGTNMPRPVQTGTDRLKPAPDRPQLARTGTSLVLHQMVHDQL